MVINSGAFVMTQQWLLYLFLIQFTTIRAFIPESVQRTNTFLRHNPSQARINLDLGVSPPVSKLKRNYQQQWTKQKSRPGRQFVIHDEETCTSGTSCKEKPTTVVLQDLSNQGTTEAANIAYEILTSLESADDHLNVVHYSLVIDAFANIGQVESAKKIIDSMMERWRYYDSDVFPNSHCFGGLLKAHINAFTNANKEENSKVQQTPTLVEDCEKILHDMSQLYAESGQRAVMPNTVIYNILLKALTEEAIFVKRQNSVNVLNPLSKADSRKTHTQNSMLQSYVDKAISILSNMEHEYENNYGLQYPKPDSYSYCTVISLLAKCVTDMEGAELAESFLEQVKPFDTASYNAVILAWSNLGTRKGAERANKLLDKLEFSINDEGSCTHGMNQIGSNDFTYNTIISAWVKSATFDGNYEHAAEQAELILRRGMDQCEKFQANVVSYSSIIDCWSRSGSLKGSKRARQLLQEMETLYSSRKNLAVKPNIITFTSCLTAHARTNTIEGAQAANALFQRMKEKCKEDDYQNFKVNLVSYFAVIDGWARSNATDAGMNALSLLSELEELYLQGEKDLKPDVRVYARVIAALVKSSDYKSAEKVLERMELYANTGNEEFALAKPNIVIYNTLINEYARQRYCKRAFGILNQMDRYNSSRESEEDVISADEHTLNGIIYALSVGNGKGKARKALKMLERLENSHINGSWGVKPSTKSYNMVINACGNSFKQDEKERAQAVDIALKVYSKVIASSHVDADRYTYISLLKAFGKLMPTRSKRRQKLVNQIFQLCCDEGLVCDDILENYILAACSSSLPPEITRMMVKAKQSKLRSSMLPSEWTFRAHRRGR